MLDDVDALIAEGHEQAFNKTPVQVQKTMFLMRQEAPALVGSGFYEFEAYNYGPFNAQIYNDLESLQQIVQRLLVGLRPDFGGMFKAHRGDRKGAHISPTMDHREPPLVRVQRTSRTWPWPLSSSRSNPSL